MPLFSAGSPNVAFGSGQISNPNASDISLAAFLPRVLMNALLATPVIQTSNTDHDATPTFSPTQCEES